MAYNPSENYRTHAQHDDQDAVEDVRMLQYRMWENGSYTPDTPPGHPPVTYVLDPYLSMHLRPSGERIFTQPEPWSSYAANLPGYQYGLGN